MLVAASNRKVEAIKMDKKAPKALEPWQVEDAKRLKELYDKAIPQKMSQALFGATYEIGSPGMVWQYISAHRPLNIRAAVSFAKGVGCKIEDFSPTIASEISEAMVYARAVPSVDDMAETELHRLSKAEVHLVTRFRLTDEDGRADLLDTADTVPVNSTPAKKPASVVRAVRKGGV